MHAADCRGPTMNFSHSSTGEPVAVRRRVDLDGNFTGSVVQRHGHQSPVAEVAEAISAEFDDFLDWPLALQTAVAIASGDSNNNVAGEYMSKEETGADKCRRTSVPSNTSSETGDGLHEIYFLVSETSGSWRDDVSERSISGSSGNEAFPSPHSDNVIATAASNPSSPFGGSSYSVVELNQAYERASEALNQEKERWNSVHTVISENGTKVSEMACRFHSVAAVSLGGLVAHIENYELQRSDLCSDAFEKWLDVIKGYVSGVCAEEIVKSPDIQDDSTQIVTHTTNLIEDTSSDQDQRVRETNPHLCYSYVVKEAVMSAKQSLSVVIQQRYVMSKLCVIAERFISRAEISCQLTLYCLKATLIVLKPAVKICMQIEVLMRALDRKSLSVPALSNAFSVIAQCTSEVVGYAEKAMVLHRDAIEAVRVAMWDLGVMRKHKLQGTRVFVDTTVAADRLLHLIRQPHVTSAQIRNVESKIKTMTDSLMPELSNIRICGTLVEGWSVKCSDTVTAVLQMLSLATQSSCNAIAAAITAAEDVSISDVT